jgi:Glycosyltransferase family 87
VLGSPAFPAAAASPSAATWWRRWASSAVVRLYFTVAVVSLVVSGYLNWHLFGGFSTRMIAGNPDDIRLFTWYLQHDLWSIAHLRNPLNFTTMNAPAGVNGMWNTSLLVPALLMAPVTALAGPLASYNLLFVLGLAAGPVCALPLLRRFARSGWAAAVGAMLFGFSPAVLAAGLGHINLVLTELMSLMLVLIYDLAAGRREVGTGGAALGLAAAAQLFTSEEILFQTGLAAAVAGAVVIVTRPRGVSGAALARVARAVGVALCVFLAFCAGGLWLQFWGPLHQHGSPFTLSFYEADLRGFYEPSHMFWLATRNSAAFAASYGGGPAEYMAYLGAPLLLVAVVVGVARIADQNARMLLGTGLIFALFSLGGTLLVGGHQTDVHLPWGVAESWPVFGSALPDRFGLVVALAAAGLLAIGLDWLLSTGWIIGLIASVVLAVACVAPLLPRPYGTTAAPGVPPFFAGTQRWIPAGSTVLVLPYPTGTQTLPLAWQTAAGMAFQMPGGYFIGPAAGGQAYVDGPGPLPLAATLVQIGQGRAAPVITPGLRAEFRQDLAYWGADAIVAGPGANTALITFVAGLVQRQPIRAGGILLWRAVSG